MPAVDPAPVRIVGYAPRWRGELARLNLEWLQRWFVVEAIDREVLGDPETHILAGGGRILFAVDAEARARSAPSRSSTKAAASTS